MPVILGGYHPTLVPEEALLHAEAIVEGEAEAVWPQVIEDLRAGHARSAGRATLSGRGERDRRSEHPARAGRSLPARSTCR